MSGTYTGTSALNHKSDALAVVHFSLFSPTYHLTRLHTDTQNMCNLLAEHLRQRTQWEVCCAACSSPDGYIGWVSSGYWPRVKRMISRWQQEESRASHRPTRGLSNSKCVKYHITFIWLAESIKQHMPLCSAAALITFHKSYDTIDASLLRFFQRLLFFDHYNTASNSWRFTACVALKNEVKHNSSVSPWQKTKQQHLFIYAVLCSTVSQGGCGSLRQSHSSNYVQWCSTTTQATCQLKTAV